MTFTRSPVLNEAPSAGAVIATAGGVSALMVNRVSTALPRFPEVSVATALILMVSPGLPSDGTERMLKVKPSARVRSVAMMVPFTMKSTKATSLPAPKVTATLAMLPSITVPSLEGVRPEMVGGVRSRAEKLRESPCSWRFPERSVACCSSTW